MIGLMAKGKGKANDAPRISNRRAMHEYFISAKVECGIALVGSEVKSLREGKAQLQDAYARVENGELFLHGAHIDPYSKAALVYNHEPRRPRKLLAHRREIKKLEGETSVKGTTLIPLAIYFKNGRAKVEIGVARGKHQHDKRDTIRKKEMDREMRRAMSRRQ
jgi:SsrA-binding protein